MALSDLSVVMPTGAGMTSGQASAIGTSFSTLHNPTSGQTHQVYLWSTNPTSVAANFTVQYSGSSNLTNETISVAAYTKQLLIDGCRINSDIALNASSSGSQVATMRITRVN